MMTKEEELDALEEFEKVYLERAEGQQRRIDLTKGIALGLFYGIIGNLFVQFFYPVVESLVTEQYSFVANVIISISAFVAIVLATLSFRNQLSWSRFVEKGERESAKVIRRMINERKAKQTMQKDGNLKSE
jgi:predicted membrane chloride channel (bestrophin family)